MHEVVLRECGKIIFGANPVGACIGTTMRCLENHYVDFIQLFLDIPLVHDMS